MNSTQRKLLLDYLREFLARPFTSNEGTAEPFEEFDKKRVSSIPEINNLVSDFLSGKIDLQDFREKHDLECREFPFWGFKGTSGQMQLNQLVKNVVGNDKESVFRKALQVPATEKEAQEKIDSFSTYILEKRATVPNASSLPRVGSVDYAIIYDAKATGEKFRVGTNDRQIYEYIKSKTDELKKLRVNRASFLIVSSQFDESPTNINLILDVYRRTRIPVVMVSASDLLFLIEEKLKDVELDHSRLEQLFLVTGILSKEKIIDVLGIR
jgi:hypothetical protein